MNEEKLNYTGADGAFSASRREIIAAIAMYAVSYVYVTAMLAGTIWQGWFAAFALLFVLTGEYLCRGVPRPRESWVWLGCLAVIVACIALGHGSVWYAPLSSLFAHAFGVWWFLSRSGRLVEGESGRFLPLDVFNGLLRFPLGNFLLRLRCLLYGMKGLRRGGAERGKGSPLAGLAAALLGALLLYLALSALAAADSAFGGLVEDILDFLTLPDIGDFVSRFVLSLPVAAWLFGLMAGALRTDEERLRVQRTAAEGALMKLRAVPCWVWNAVMALFCAVYALFFALQGSYLFGAFFRRLPEGFIVSQYAREGFFELCRVMAINFVLLWLVTRTSRAGEKARAQKVLCTLILAAGMLFAVVAFSKLALYISCFGFTPKRLQSSWLVTVLFAGSAAATYSLWSGKKTFKYWLMFSAITLAALHIV